MSIVFTSDGLRLDVMAPRTWSPRLAIGCWAIEHPDGVIVVDPGESSHAKRVDRRRPGPARPDPRTHHGPPLVVVARGDDLALIAGNGA
jgi:hypothetical protein